ncbi:MAG: S8/S53 family peptidase [Gemmataceae bacterium]
MAGRPAMCSTSLFTLLRPEQLLGDPPPPARRAGVRGQRQRRRPRPAAGESLARGASSPAPIEGWCSDDRPDPLPDGGRASSPHGTTVADILLTVAPRVRLFSADVFGPQGSCDIRVLIRAIRHAMDVWGCQVINLSLGVPEARLGQVQRRLELQRAVEEAYYRDVVVIAAAHNDHPLTRSYPAAFAPPLLSVDRGCSPIRCGPVCSIACTMEFELSFSCTGPFATEPATSWAAPHLAGIAARLLALRPGLKPFEVKALAVLAVPAAAGQAAGDEGCRRSGGVACEQPPNRERRIDHERSVPT